MTAPERDWDEQDQRPVSAQTEPDTWARRLDVQRIRASVEAGEAEILAGGGVPLDAIVGEQP